MVETEYCQGWQFQYNFPNHSISSTPDAIHGKETAPRDLFVVLRLKDGRVDPVYMYRIVQYCITRQIWIHSLRFDVDYCTSNIGVYAPNLVVRQLSNTQFDETQIIQVRNSPQRIPPDRSGVYCPPLP